MAIKEYQEDGKILYAVSVNVRSKVNPTLRLQPGRKGIETREKALKIETELRRKAEREIAIREISGCLWSDLVFDFADYCEAEASRGYPILNTETLNDYIAAIRKWTGSWMNKQASSITSEDIRCILREMKEAGKSNDHQVKIRHIIHKIFKFGSETRRIPSDIRNPTLDVKWKRERSIRRVGLTSEQLKLFLRATKEYEPEW